MPEYHPARFQQCQPAPKPNTNLQSRGMSIYRYQSKPQLDFAEAHSRVVLESRREPPPSVICLAILLRGRFPTKEHNCLDQLKDIRTKAIVRTSSSRDRFVLRTTGDDSGLSTSTSPLPPVSSIPSPRICVRTWSRISAGRTLNMPDNCFFQGSSSHTCCGREATAAFPDGSTTMFLSGFEMEV